jgi:hypothetical protein
MANRAHLEGFRASLRDLSGTLVSVGGFAGLIWVGHPTGEFSFGARIIGESFGHEGYGANLAINGFEA